jgi:hypothetical protein
MPTTTKKNDGRDHHLDELDENRCRPAASCSPNRRIENPSATPSQ